MSCPSCPTKPEVSEKPAPKADQEAATMALLELTYPSKEDMTRRIHKLWPGAWRINYHSLDNGYVVDSVFVTVENMKIKEVRG